MQQKWNQNFDGEPMTDIPQKFLNAGCDVYMVMQLRHDEKIFDERFASMLLSLRPIQTGNTFTITSFTTPLHWTAPGNSGIFCCPGLRYSV